MPADPPPPGYKRRRRRWENDIDVRFMTFSCYRQLPLLGHPRIRDLFVETLANARLRHHFALHACVVMPEHVHLLFRPAPGGSWAAIAESLKTSVARRVIGRWRDLNAPILSRLGASQG